MKILTVGGGSGGHIVPVVAVVEELNRLAPEAELFFWCDRKSLIMAKQLFVKQKITIRAISAGKFRRYHHFKWWQHLRPSILLPNLLDLFKIAIGFVQSFWRLIWLRPDVIFAKGGFVCLPVGIVAHWLGIKLIVHDSDTVAGLTNRIISRHAVKITTGMPTEYYNYPTDKTVFVGSPVRLNANLQSSKKLRQELKIAPDQKIVLVTGGGLGSEFLNQLSVRMLNEIDARIVLILITGKANYHRVVKQVFDDKRLIVRDFVTNYADYVAMSDVVVARAGATTIAELAVAQKPTIFVPNPKLVEGHQLKNAQMLVDKQAAMVLDEFRLEKNPEEFAQAINQLVFDKQKQIELAKNFAAFANPKSAEALAKIILTEAKTS